MKSCIPRFKPNRIKPPNFALGDKVIPSVDQCKYMGIIVSVKIKMQILTSG